MTPSPTNRKRKAESLSDEDGTDRPAPAVRKSKDDRHLPAPVWGHVLDYMPYEEVRSALLVGKIIANDAVKYVHALNITKVCQMDGPSTRRFPNIEELSILCMYNFETDELCKETCQRIVSLLACFSKLKQVFAGGVDDDGDHAEYEVRYSDIDQDREARETFRVLINHILSAYKMRVLPKSIETMGSLCREALDLQRLFLGENPEGGSSLRRDICAHFPLKDLLICNAAFQVNISGGGGGGRGGGRDGYVGDDSKEIFCMIKGRPGGKEMMLNFSGQYLVENFLNDNMKYFDLEGNGSDRTELLQRLSQAGVIGGEYRWEKRQAQFLTKDALKCLDELIEIGFDPCFISREDLYKSFDIGIERRKYDVFAKATFDALVSRGFAFDEKDVIVLDETKEPVLSKIPALIRGIEE